MKESSHCARVHSGRAAEKAPAATFHSWKAGGVDRDQPISPVRSPILAVLFHQATNGLGRLCGHHGLGRPGALLGPPSIPLRQSGRDARRHPPQGLGAGVSFRRAATRAGPQTGAPDGGATPGQYEMGLGHPGHWQCGIKGDRNWTMEREMLSTRHTTDWDELREVT